MNIRYIIAALEELAPPSIQESWDNSGLQVGLPAEGDGEVHGVLTCLDVNEARIAEAVAKGCNMVVSHHPLIFKGLKHITDTSVAERAVAAAIRAGVAVYSAHTSLDSAAHGISEGIAQLLGAQASGVLQPIDMPMVKITAVCRREDADDVRLLLLGTEPEILESAETRVTTRHNGDATFDIIHTPLTSIEVTVPQNRVRAITSALQSYDGHGQVTVSTEVLAERTAYGLGQVLVYDEPLTMAAFRERVRDAFGCKAVRCSNAAADDVQVRRFAVCGGSGGEFIPLAISRGMDAYVSADIRYHDFADHGDALAIFDVGHYESEICAKNIISRFLQNKFRNFAVYTAENESNPVNYII